MVCLLAAGVCQCQDDLNLDNFDEKITTEFAGQVVNDFTGVSMQDCEQLFTRIFAKLSEGKQISAPGATSDGRQSAQQVGSHNISQLIRLQQWLAEEAGKLKRAGSEPDHRYLPRYHSLKELGSQLDQCIQLVQHLNREEQDTQSNGGQPIQGSGSDSSSPTAAIGSQVLESLRSSLREIEREEAALELRLEHALKDLEAQQSQEASMASAGAFSEAGERHYHRSVSLSSEINRCRLNLGLQNAESDYLRSAINDELEQLKLSAMSPVEKLKQCQLKLRHRQQQAWRTRAELERDIWLERYKLDTCKANLRQLSGSPRSRPT